MSISSLEQIDCLAIHGGTPIRQAPMPARYAFDIQDRKIIDEVFDWYYQRGEDPGYQGHFEELYCKEITGYMGGGYADAVATGTASLFVALAALDLPKQSDVLVSPITDPGTLSAIILLGLRPKLVDTSPNNYNICLDTIKTRIDKNTACLLLVHAAGQAVADIQNIANFCHERGIKLLEDCSQSHGARAQGQLVGTFGDIAAFSTMYRKASITGPTGGFVYTKNEHYYQQALAHADRGKPRWITDFNDRDPSQFLFPALNLHLGEIGCAIGVASWKRLPETIRKRQDFVKKLAVQIANNSKICSGLPINGSESPFYYPIFVDTTKITVSKIDFAKALMAEGIPLNPHYLYLVEDWPWLKPYLVDDFKCQEARNARDRSFCLYLNENYTEMEVRDIITAIQKVENYFIK